MRDFTVGHLPSAYRSTVRPVALAYRRTRRALQAEGTDARDAERLALAAAKAEYRRHIPETASLLDREIRTYALISAAINADPQWFWHGPDA